MFLFGLPFLGVGLFMAGWTALIIVEYFQAQSWPSVPAVYEELVLKEISGDDSSSHSLTATYTYRYNGQEYTGHRVGLHEGADNIGHWHESSKAYLEALRDQDRAVAYVNPNEPAEALLKRDLRPGLTAFKAAFGLIFTLVGGAISGAALFAKDKKKLPEPTVSRRKSEAITRAGGMTPASVKQHFTRQGEGADEEPDVADDEEADHDEDEDDDEEELEDGDEFDDEDEEYVDNVPEYSAQQRILKHSNAGSLGFLIIFGLIWNAVSWGIAIMLYSEFLKKAEKEPFIWLFLLFPLIGLLLIYSILVTLMKHFRYGISTLELATMPGILGGKLSGAITTRGNLGDSRSVEVALSCMKETTTRDSDGDSRTSTLAVWNDSYELRADALPRTAGQTSIPVLFALPYDQPMSSGPRGNRTFWKLSVNAVRPGADYDADWEVPVFRTRESDPRFEMRENPLATYLVDPEPEEALRRVGVNMRTTASGGKSWYFAPTPIRSGAPGCAMFTLVVAAVLMLVFSIKAPILAMVGVSVFFLISLTTLAHMLLGRAEIRVENGVLSLNSGIAGFNSTKTFPVSEVESVETNQSMSTNNAVFYQLSFRMQNGRKLNGGKQVKGHRLIKALKETVEAELLR